LNPGRTDWSCDKSQNYPQRKDQQSLTGPPKWGQLPIMMRGCTWSRSNHLMGTRLLCLRDNSDNFSWTPQKNRSEMMINQTTPVTGLFNNYVYLLFPCPNSSSN
jgi:hypothetical protein